MTEQTTQPNVQESIDIEARIDAEIEAEMGKADKAEEAAEEAAEEVESTEESEQEEQEAEEEETHEEQPKKRRKGEAQRLREKNKRLDDDLKQRDARLAALETQNAQLLEALKKSLVKEEKPKDEESFEPIDEEAFKRTKGEIDEVKLSLAQQRFADKFENFVEKQKASNPQWESETRDALLIHKAHDLYRRGLATDEHDAVEKASAEMAHDLAVYYQKGKSFAEYFSSYSDEIERVNAKNKRPKQNAKGSNVDMVQLEKLRKSAGAPTNKVAPVNVTSRDALKQIDADLEKDRASGNW